jgi:hypothetical protein
MSNSLNNVDYRMPELPVSPAPAEVSQNQAQSSAPPPASAGDLAGVPAAVLADGSFYQSWQGLALNLEKLNAAAPEVQQAVSASIAVLTAEQQSALSSFCAKITDGLSAAARAAAAGERAGLSSVYAGIGAALEDAAILNLTADASAAGTLAKTLDVAGKILDLLQKPGADTENISVLLAELKTTAESGSGTGNVLAGTLYTALGFLDSAAAVGMDKGIFLRLISGLNIPHAQSAQTAQAAVWSLTAILSEQVLRELDVRAAREETETKDRNARRKEENKNDARRERMDEQTLSQALSGENARLAAAANWLRAQAAGGQEAARLLNALALAEQAASGQRMPV